MNETGGSTMEQKNPEAIKQRILELRLTTFENYNNFLRMIDIGQTFPVAMGSDDLKQLEMSEDIVRARNESGITEEDIEQFRSFGGWGYLESSEYTEDDLQWLKSYAGKVDKMFQIMTNMGYSEKQIRA